MEEEPARAIRRIILIQAVISFAACLLAAGIFLYVFLIRDHGNDRAMGREDLFLFFIAGPIGTAVVGRIAWGVVTAAYSVRLQAAHDSLQAIVLANSPALQYSFLPYREYTPDQSFSVAEGQPDDVLDMMSRGGAYELSECR
jgi:hypothetical protein